MRRQVLPSVARWIVGVLFGVGLGMESNKAQACCVAAATNSTITGRTHPADLSVRDVHRPFLQGCSEKLLGAMRVLDQDCPVAAQSLAQGDACHVSFAARSFGRTEGRPAVPLVLALTLFALLGARLQGHALSPDEYDELNIRRLFVVQGWAWTDQGLVIVDVPKKRFVRYDAGANQAVFLGKGAWRYPESVNQQASHLLVLDEGALAIGQPDPRSQIIRFEGALEKLGTKMVVSGLALDHLEKVFGPTPGLDVIYSWSPLSDGILTFGDIGINNGARSKSAFFYTDGRGDQDVFRQFKTSDDVCNEYTLTFASTATVGDRGIILLRDCAPKILVVTPGVSEARERPSFPKNFQDQPVLETQGKWATTREVARQATNFYRILESSTMAAGIYGHDGYLFLLAKKAIDAKGRAEWCLIKLDSNDGSELSGVFFPTHAAHLTVFPWPTFWVLIETRSVQGIGERHAPHMDLWSIGKLGASFPAVEASHVGRFADPFIEWDFEVLDEQKGAGLIVAVGELARTYDTKGGQEVLSEGFQTSIPEGAEV